ncbi:tRNA wybutosine-synthesizing protein 2 homolog [Trichonephila inaurata madagascariensis]|uniref:tRNA(Phe) (4-demethylwyosine(37)-C(7)) aminocarboxypropyltransferase n=1 Tax=Trichonephila inaurata madagascariensis TaxID=2747483 RepID=A0A8X6IFI3_9ARAC|nr:tRNA wybutosine-synthesizing protein 2 homolog [Trichonephila inaurata madagascariensis]
MTKKQGKQRCLSPYMFLKSHLSEILEELKLDKKLLDDIPAKWEKHGDLILLPASSFQNKMWSPCVEILRGSDGWVLHIDNKIKYTYDITKCMFSAGNISEKLRIAELSCEGETVVDLYAGIGYFTLPFLIHAKASFVHACEWNPYAVEALSKNLTLNKVKNKCIIYYGDNREVCPEKVADRVNLGLIPSCERGWETACKALKPCGGILHIHGNVTSNLHSAPKTHFDEKDLSSPKKVEWTVWTNNVCFRLRNIFHELYSTDWTVSVLNVTKIKSYAPHIDHLVADIQCKPPESVGN